MQFAKLDYMVVKKPMLSELFYSDGQISTSEVDKLRLKTKDYKIRAVLT
jgi:hypothetical protein